MRIMRTLVGKVAIGFSFVLLLMISTTYVAISNQQKISVEFRLLSDDILPLLQLVYTMKGSVLNSNKAVSQHAASTDHDMLAALVDEFQ